MLKTLLSLLLNFTLHPVIAFDDGASNLWWLPPRGSDAIYCECIPFYACKNNTIVQENLKYAPVERLINVISCTYPIDVCCRTGNLPPGYETLTSASMIASVNKNPRPEIDCECAYWETCRLNKIVSDGKGKKSSPLENIGLVTHSKCQDDLEVCCEREKYPADRTLIEKRMEVCSCVATDRCSQINDNGLGIVQPRHLLANTQNEECEEKDHVCCKGEYITEKSSSIRSIHSHTSLLLILDVFISFFIFS